MNDEQKSELIPKLKKTTFLNLVLIGTIELLIRKIVICTSQYGRKNGFWDKLVDKKLPDSILINND